MTKAAELAKMGEVLTNSQIGGRRNVIINGAMQVAQRGTSFTSAGYTLDRFNLSLSGATGTVTQESFALDSEIAGIKNYLKLDVTTGNNFCGIQHRIEDVQSIKGNEEYTISFYAKGTNSGGGNLALRGRQYFGSGGSTEVITFTESITLTGSWQRFTFTKTQNSLSGKTIGTGSYFEIFFHQPELDTSTDAWELDITGVQLEVGEQATPFEHRSYGEELALCQRYYHRISRGSGASSPVSVGFHTGTQHRGLVHFTTAMRSSPTVDKSSLSDINVYHGGGIVTPTAISNEGVSDTSITAVRFAANSTGASNGDATIIQLSSNAFIDFDSEL